MLGYSFKNPGLMSVCLVQRAQSRPPDRRMFALKNRFDKKSTFTRPEIQVSATSKALRDSGRAFFLLLTQ